MSQHISKSATEWSYQWIANAIHYAKAQGLCIVDTPTNITLTGNDSNELMNLLQHVILRGKTQLINARDRVCHPLHLSFPRLFAPTLRNRHLSNFRKKLHENKPIKWVFAGDSILSIGADIVAPSESPLYAWTDEILKQNPLSSIKFYNLAIPSTSWKDIATSTPCLPWWGAPSHLSWLDYIISLKPDVITLWFGGNDSHNFDPESMINTLERIKNELPECDILLCVTYQPSYAGNAQDYNTVSGQHGRLIAQQYTRSYARSKDYGYLDFGRWHRMARDGYDPCEISLTRIVPHSDSTFPEFGGLYEIINGFWKFPELQNDNNVSANSCTDWSIGFSLNKKVRSLCFPLSGIVDTKRANMCRIVFNDNKITIAIEDGRREQFSHVEEIHHDFNIDSDIFLNITLKDSRLTISTQHNKWTPDMHSVIMGGGFIEIFDRQIPRFGGRYHPYLQVENCESLSVYNLCVADSTKADAGCARFMPFVTNYSLYKTSYSAGGSGNYHQNTYGVRETLTPVIRQENWSS